MPLISLKDFPGAATKDYGAATRPIADAVRFLAGNQMRTNENMRQEQAQVQERMRQEGVLDARRDLLMKKGQLAQIYNMQDDYDITTPHGREIALHAMKKSIAQLGQADANPESVQPLLDANNLDELHNMLAKAMMTADQAKIAIDDAIGPKAPPGYKYVAAHPAGGGDFVAAYVPEDPTSGAPIIPVSDKYQKKAMVEIDNRDYKIPPNFKPNPDQGKVSKEYPQGDPRDVIPIVGSEKGVSGETAKVSEISKAGRAAAAELQEKLKSGAITQETLAAAATPGMFNYFKSANVQEFEVLRNDLTDMIGRLRSGGAINQDEEARFMNMLPTFGDKDDVMELKVNRLSEMFGSIGASLDPSQKIDGSKEKTKALSDYTVDQLDAMSLEELEELEALQ